MSDGTEGLLERLSSEIADLGARVVPATAIVTGQLKDFSDASGSGWLFNTSHLVTNFHVVDGLTVPIRIRMPEHPEIEVRLAGSDPLTDLAVLELPGPVTEGLRLRAEPARLGELCFAFGSPLGEYPESMTMGVITGLRRRLMSPGGRMIEDVLQTDAAITHGNSGGPLTDASGLVLGVNSAVDVRTSNIGFAVPATVVADVVTELLEHHEVARPSLGLSVVPAIINTNGRQQEGLRVLAVRADSAGSFQPGDVLLNIGGHEVHTRGDLLRVLRRDLINKVVQVQVLRGDTATTIDCHPLKLTTE
jgi:S1-C subfamily serine protease